jgi:hypothetical protein
MEASMAEVSPDALVLNDDNLGAFVLCDATLLGILWMRESPELRLLLQTGDGRHATLCCTWPSAIIIDLRDPPFVPLSWESRFERDGKTWHMVFDFASSGVIKLNCYEARLVYDQPAKTP